MTRAAMIRRAGTVLALALVVAPGSTLAGDASGIGVGDPAPLAQSFAIADPAEAATLEGGIALRVSRGNAGIAVEGRFPTQASVQTVWSVLTDYDSIERFVSSIRDSRMTRRADDSVFVEQQAVGRLLLFSRRLSASLRIVEVPRRRIEFEDLLHKDFRTYRGEWRIEESATGTTVIYRLEADPSFPIPDFVARGLFRGTARELLSQVRSEIERRSGLAARR